MITDAIMSDDGRYRYTLIRQWNSRPLMVWCMLNPSTADAAQDDPTIRRCISFAVREGYGGIHVVNLMAYRATYPAAALSAPDPCGPRNDEHLRLAAQQCDCIVVAWGARATRSLVERAVLSFRGGGAQEFRCLGTTQDGNPRHPLYVRSNEPFKWWALPGAGEGGKA